MQDKPSATQLEAIANAALAGGDSVGVHAAFQARVAANVLDIVKRERDYAPQLDTQEMQRLEDLLGQSGDLHTLNRILCERIAANTLDLTTPKLVAHLIATTMGKLSIDQPRYAGYAIALEKKWGQD